MSRRICVRGICAQMCGGEFARNLCPDFGRRNVRGEFVQICAGRICAPSCVGDVRRHCARVCGGKYFLVDDARGDFFLSPMCAGMFSGMGGGIRVRKWAPGGPGGPKKGQKGPKMPKMAQNGPKWPKRGGCPKMAQNGTFCPRVVHEWFGGHCV